MGFLQQRGGELVGNNEIYFGFIHSMSDGAP
jgi:hypothetical protein